MTATLTPVAATGTARLPVRPAYVALGLVLTATAIVMANVWDTGISSVLVFAVLPDVALLAGIGGLADRGQLPRHAVPAYNFTHHPATPGVLLALAVTGLLGDYWLVAALAWSAHIAMDRGFGYGLRTKDGWQRG